MLRLILGLLASLLATGPASATLIEFTFTGDVDAIDHLDRFPAEWGETEIGNPLVFRFVFESTTPDSQADPDIGDYVNAILSYQVTIGGVTATSSLGGDIQLYNYSGPGGPLYDARSLLPDTTTAMVMLSDSPLFPTDALPLDLDLASFGSTHLELNSGDGGGITGDVSTFTSRVVPEPSTALLMACGLVGLALRARR